MHLVFVVEPAPLVRYLSRILLLCPIIQTDALDWYRCRDSSTRSDSLPWKEMKLQMINWNWWNEWELRELRKIRSFSLANVKSNWKCTHLSIAFSGNFRSSFSRASVSSVFIFLNFDHGWDTWVTRGELSWIDYIREKRAINHPSPVKDYGTCLDLIAVRHCLSHQNVEHCFRLSINMIVKTRTRAFKRLFTLFVMWSEINWSKHVYIIDCHRSFDFIHALYAVFNTAYTVSIFLTACR